MKRLYPLMLLVALAALAACGAADPPSVEGGADMDSFWRG
ncbi:MAG: hypothetical protein HLUCCA12_12610 [Rhodobacteraceae bacterium HLUCCA12]|nr:MAG: hypothetical protein HLUCCA12_12610 [Rhodobacteraceae bacterium HLUCCA12]